MEKQRDHLPVFGVGPFYVLFCLLCTCIGLVLKNMGYLDSGNIAGAKILRIIPAVFFILSGFFLWMQAVIFQNISKEINNGKLVTGGIYGIVRNPIYSAFLFLFTGVLILAWNYFLLILPFIFWVFLTILMKYTEEKWLKEKFGNVYDSYCRKVNRIIPWFPKASR